jgi:hypothetical protein
MRHFALRLTAVAMSLAWLAALAQTPSTPAPAAPAAVLPAPSTVPAAKPVPAARWTVQQIRESFDLADSDSNGELSRAEAQRLTIMPRSFEDMDQNKDGVLQRSEYEAGFPH